MLKRAEMPEVAILAFIIILIAITITIIMAIIIFSKFEDK